MKMMIVVLAACVVSTSCLSEHVAGTGSNTDVGIDQLCGANLGAAVVQIKNHAFNPAQLTVAPGTRVTWANCDADIHSSTSDASVWDSGMLSPRTSYSRVMDAAGNFAYHCEPHPFMVASVRVE
jgi:plastocyanin